MALRDAIRGTREKLEEWYGRLRKRRVRVAYCKAQQALWKRRARRAEENGWTEKAERATRKLAYWHEQLDKAVLGKKEAEAVVARLEKKMKYLKEQLEKQQPPDGLVTPTKPWNPYNRTGPGWMIPWFDKVWNSGTHFEIVSWYRTPEYSESLCQNMCGAPTCPGTCAGRNTNHACPPTNTGVKYEGAADVSNYYAVRAALDRFGAPLTNHLPRDPVHVSHSGY